MRKKLVICPNCQLQSKKTVSKWKGNGFNIEIVRPKPFVIGEIDDDRNFKIKRGGENYTIISGSQFEVLCGNCGEKVYIKEIPPVNLTKPYFSSNMVLYAYTKGTTSQEQRILLGTQGTSFGTN